MASPSDSRVPLPVIMLIGTGLAVLTLILARLAIHIVIGLVNLALILLAFVGLGVIGLFLVRRGDIRGRRGRSGSD
ncbi:MAG: hypothetical protein R2761_07395 [Acidimicrobiales bacterium]